MPQGAAVEIIQPTRIGGVLSASDGDMRHLREEFRGRYCVKLRRLIEPKLCEHILRRIEQAEFESRTHAGVGVELCLSDAGLTGARTPCE